MEDKEKKTKSRLSAQIVKGMPNDLFSPVRLHLNFPESLQVMLLGNKHLTHKPVDDISYPSLITETHFVLSARD